MTKCNCDHVTLLKYSLILNELRKQHIKYCNECLSDESTHGYCLYCQTNLCREHLKQHVCKYNHLLVLLKNGDFICLQCNTFINSEEQTKITETFIHESRKLYNCKQIDEGNQILQELYDALMQQKQNHELSGYNIFSRKRDNQLDNETLNKDQSQSDDALSINTQLMLDSSLSFSQNVKSPANSTQFTNPLYQPTMNDGNSNTSISSYFNINDQYQKKFATVQFSDQICFYFQFLFQQPIECYKISSKQKLNKRFIYLYSKQFDISNNNLNQRLKDMSSDDAKTFYIVWNGSKVPYEKIKDHTSGLCVTDIQSLTKNKDTNTFNSYLEKTKQKKHQHEALSFLTFQRTLDLTFKNQQDRKCLEFCIKYILSKIYT